MTKPSNLLFTLLAVTHTFLLFALAACNLPQSAKPPAMAVEDQAATLVEETLQAEQQPVTLPSPQATPTLAVTETPQPTITPTYSLPVLVVSEDTNCRAGPGQDYEIIAVIRSGKQVEVVGHSTNGNYWIVKEAAGNPCWLWGEYATPSGSIHTVPSMTPPPTTTPGLPAAPSNLRYNFVCAYNGIGSDVTTSLEWNDKARDEKGYRIYRDGAFIAELPANSTSFVETAAIPLGAQVTYSVEAFNDTGASARATISFTCQ